MGQKINSFLFRLILNRNWNTVWYTDKKNFSNYLLEDLIIRDYIYKNLKNINISKIIIQKSINDVYVFVYFFNIKNIKYNFNIKNLNYKISFFLKRKVFINLKNINKININLNYIFYKIKKIILNKSYKNHIKIIINKLFKEKGVLGVKILLKGRLNGSIMSKKQVYLLGSIPFNRISANIKYLSNNVKTIYGIIGVKIWIYFGDFIYI